MNVDSNIKNLKGIGPVRARLLSKLDINTIKDILYFFPRDYMDLSPLTFKQGCENSVGAFPCIVTGTAVTRRARSGIYITKLPITDGKNKGYAVFFNQPYIGKSFYRNQRLLLIGKIKRNFGVYEITSPEWVKFEKNKTIELDRITPIYPLTKGISQKIMRNTIKNAIKSSIGLTEILPKDIICKYNLLSVQEAIRNIHFPESFRKLEKARERFIFEELLLFQLDMGLARFHLKAQKRKNYYKDLDLEPFLSCLPFTPTSGQNKVIRDIIKDLEGQYIMNRLVQGDVGSGKTLVACAALYLAVINGFQGVMMAPTEILVDQHYNTLKQFLRPHNVNVEILKGGVPEKRRKEILARLKQGDVDVLVGTHAIIQKDVEFKQLGMIITDEQHRFGVRQREELVNKGQYPDVIVMSATPIPRTVAMVLYSDLDISTIDTLPVGRQKVDTYVVNETMRKRVYDFMAKEANKGHLAYVVCPAVEENELGMTNVEEHWNFLREKYLDIRIGMLHGKMKQEEKERIISQFLSKKIQVLVSTTVIEVGVDVPYATLMIIENAERFGLAQLHQLRGRVGRSTLKSYCILISGSNQETARERLKYMMSCHDGFKISQKDLEQRGPGEFLGLKQHGFGELKLASFVNNTEILEKTQKLAAKILQEEYLSLPEYQNLKKTLYAKRL